jgi:hypothetical protein
MLTLHPDLENLPLTPVKDIQHELAQFIRMNKHYLNKIRR